MVFNYWSRRRKHNQLNEHHGKDLSFPFPRLSFRYISSALPLFSTCYTKSVPIPLQPGTACEWHWWIMAMFWYCLLTLFPLLLFTSCSWSSAPACLFQRPLSFWGVPALPWGICSWSPSKPSLLFGAPLSKSVAYADIECCQLPPTSASYTQYLAMLILNMSDLLYRELIMNIINRSVR